MTDAVDERGLLIWPAAERNKQPILDQLKDILPHDEGIFLEISSGTGQHAEHFARALPHYHFIVSDCDEQHLGSLRRRIDVCGLSNLKGPIDIDVTQMSWPKLRAQVVYNANMIHIAPWRAVDGLFRGTAGVLDDQGLLLTYGPYKVNGEHTAESNARFDESLRSRNPDWGVRDILDLEGVARSYGLRLSERRAMPANNFLLVWRAE